MISFCYRMTVRCLLLQTTISVINCHGLNIIKMMKKDSSSSKQQSSYISSPTGFSAEEMLLLLDSPVYQRPRQHYPRMLPMAHIDHREKKHHSAHKHHAKTSTTTTTTTTTQTPKIHEKPGTKLRTMSFNVWDLMAASMQLRR